MIQAIIFDLDNTLTDFMKMKHAAIDAAVDGMIDAGLSLTRQATSEKIYRVYDREGIEYQQVFDRFLQEELGRVDYKILTSAVVAYRRARDSYLVLYPHVNLTLMELAKRGLRLAVVSDAPRIQAWLRLAQLQLQHYFDSVVAFEDTGERKPSPKPFQRALEMLAIAPDQAIMVGDWPERDVLGAKQVGIRTAFARYGDTFGTKESGADYDLNDIYELVGIVDRLNGSN
ncbi:MAG TPA: HAD-IA family hydrolase [Candidatus Eisenbacteria bacterium]